MKRRTDVPSVTQVPEADWATEMREFFEENGAYRESDLDQLLGKPWETVHVDASGHLELTSRLCRSDDD
jgi:hypothetical protein